jgi:thiamine pyrophosphate-dependent acetolactate synthase large subunit-like protein
MIGADSSETKMDKDLIAKLAHQAGLDKALAEFPDDVAAAAEQALGNRGAIEYPTDPAAEPWPPMRAGTGL